MRCSPDTSLKFRSYHRSTGTPAANPATTASAPRRPGPPPPALALARGHDPLAGRHISIVIPRFRQAIPPAHPLLIVPAPVPPARWAQRLVGLAVLAGPVLSTGQLADVPGEAPYTVVVDGTQIARSSHMLTLTLRHGV